MKIWEIVMIAIVMMLFAIKLIFQVEIHFIKNNIVVYYWSINKKKRMSFII